MVADGRGTATPRARIGFYAPETAGVTILCVPKMTSRARIRFDVPKTLSKTKHTLIQLHWRDASTKDNVNAARM